ncbi:hypothetical protein L211DRAFT_839840, partial [Terfezia boudieri ATCC MYA-4762]
MTRSLCVQNSPSPYTLIHPVIKQFLSKRPTRDRLYQYFNWLYPHIRTLPSPNQTLHTIATTTFLHELHTEVINTPLLLTVLSKVVRFCGSGGSKVGEACGGDWNAVDHELKEWLDLSNPNGIKLYIVEHVKKGVFQVRPIFDGREWGWTEEWTVEELETHPVGALYLPAELFYGLETCYGKGIGKEEDRTKFDTLLTLSYLREICRAVAVWARAKDKMGNVATEGWFTWGMKGTGRNGIINESAVEMLQRHIFLGSQLVGLTACRKHEYLARKMEETKLMMPQLKSKLPVIASPTSPFPPVIFDPHSKELTFFAHYGPSNLPNGPLLRDGKLAVVGLHHPISAEALHAYLEDTFDGVNFPGKKFRKQHDGIYFPDLAWEFGRDWDELCPKWGFGLEGCYEMWVVDGRLGRYEGREAMGPWEPVELEMKMDLGKEERERSGFVG